MNMPRLAAALLLAALPAVGEVAFRTDFEDGSLGRVEKIDDRTYHCRVAGQVDEHGRNRQASWFYFRLDHLEGQPVTIVLSDFVGEYNNKPGACPMNAETIPYSSVDGVNWQPFPGMQWDDTRKEATLKIEAKGDSLWIAHVPPYPTSRLEKLLSTWSQSPIARVEAIGQTVHHRTIHLVTVTEPARGAENKKTLWMQSRQHAWEAGTSFVMEGALRFITSSNLAAVDLRRRFVFKFTPMVDPDGCAEGMVRFNANGYDVNRHWDEIDIRDESLRARMPEIWQVKKAILDYHARHPIDLMINLHNTEISEYLETEATDPDVAEKMRSFENTIKAGGLFDPSRPLVVSAVPGSSANSLYATARVPVFLMEQRITKSPALGRRATTADRLLFGEKLIQALAAAAADVEKKKTNLQ